MSPLEIQLVSGVIVALISFILGYLLFRSQTEEQIRLEVYRRRLDSYDRITQLLEELDIYIHDEASYSHKRTSELMYKTYEVVTLTHFYVPQEISIILNTVPDHLIEKLDERVGDLEEIKDVLTHIMWKDTGRYLSNQTVAMLKTKRGKERNQQIEDTVKEYIQPLKDMDLI